MRARDLICRLFFIVLVAFAAMWGSPLHAEDQMPAAAPADDPAIVAMGSRMITILRANVYGITPKMRKEAAEERIQTALWEEEADFSTKVIGEGTVIFYGEHFLFAITHGDLDQLVGETMTQKVNSAIDALDAVFEQSRRGRNPVVLAEGAAWSVLFTVVYLALLIGSFLVSGRIHARLQQRWTQGARPREVLLEASVIMRRLVVSFVILALTLAWLSGVLKSFPQTEAAGSDLAGSFTQALSGLVSGTVASVPNLLIAMVIGAIVMVSIRCLNAVVKAILLGRLSLPGIDAEVAKPTATVLKVLLLLIGLITAYPYMPGTSSEAFKGISLMAGLMVSLGSATLFGQISAGFVLMYSGSFKRGDWIAAGNDIEGRLVEIGYLTTRVQTFREEVNIPNLVLLAQATRNLSRAPLPDVAPIAARVSIGYDAPWRQVYRLLEEAAATTPDILTNPGPVVHQVDLSDFYVIYELTAYIERTTSRRTVRSRLYENIQDAFNKAGVQIMSPHFEGNPAQKVFVPPGEWEGAKNETR